MYILLDRIQSHAKLSRYLGRYGKGILLTEANHGNLQAYLDSNPTITTSLRLKWSMQVVEAVEFVHSKGVIHSDLRPENYLVHATNESFNLWLCDFGGARCDKLGSNVYHLPDDPFFDPRMPWESTPATDIFSLGSIIYNIMTGYWPYKELSSLVVTQDKDPYETLVNQKFAQGDFPDVSTLSGGIVIKGCWGHQYKTAEEVLSAIKSEMAAMSKGVGDKGL